MFVCILYIFSQALKDDFPLSHVISPFTNQERREGMLLNLLIPFVLTVGSGSKGKHGPANVLGLRQTLHLEMGSRRGKKG